MYVCMCIYIYFLFILQISVKKYTWVHASTVELLEPIFKAAYVFPIASNYIHFQLCQYPLPLRSVSLSSQVLGPGVKLEELQLDVLELSVVRKPQREVTIYTPKQAGQGGTFGRTWNRGRHGLEIPELCIFLMGKSLKIQENSWNPWKSSK